MTSKTNNTEEVVLENSTVVLNDDTTATTAEPQADECQHGADCTCEWGKCPKDTCERYYENPAAVPASQEFIYHLDADGNKTSIKKANPNYKAPEQPTDPKPVDPKPTEPTQPADPTPSNDCGDETDEPWAHDTVGELKEEIRTHAGIAYNVIDKMLDDLANAADENEKNDIIAHFAWHIPTGGPKAIKAHHKAKIIEALKNYKG